MMEVEFNHLNHATLGVQVPRRVHAEVPQEAAIRQNKTASRSSVSRPRAPQGMPDRGGASDARSRPYVDFDSSKIFGGTDHRIHEREELDMDRAECRTEDAKFSGPQILGTRILCYDGRAGRGSDQDLHQKPRTSRPRTGSA